MVKKRIQSFSPEFAPEDVLIYLTTFFKKDFRSYGRSRKCSKFMSHEKFEAEGGARWNFPTNRRNFRYCNLEK